MLPIIGSLQDSLTADRVVWSLYLSTWLVLTWVEFALRGVTFAGVSFLVASELASSITFSSANSKFFFNPSSPSNI